MADLHDNDGRWTCETGTSRHESSVSLWGGFFGEDDIAQRYVASYTFFGWWHNLFSLLSNLDSLRMPTFDRTLQQSLRREIQFTIGSQFLPGHAYLSLTCGRRKTWPSLPFVMLLMYDKNTKYRCSAMLHLLTLTTTTLAARSVIGHCGMCAQSTAHGPSRRGEGAERARYRPERAFLGNIKNGGCQRVSDEILFLSVEPQG